MSGISKSQISSNSLFEIQSDFQLERSPKQISNYQTIKKQQLLQIDKSYFKQYKSYQIIQSPEPANKYELVYKELDTVGSGYQSTIKKVYNNQTKSMYAAKIYTLRGSEEESQIRLEFNILKELNHSNIIRVHEIIEDLDKMKIYIIMEYFSGQPLSDYIENNHEIDENNIYKILIQLLSAFQEIHSQNIIHRDLNLENILYNEERNEIKVIDFGLAQKIAIEEYHMSPVGNFEKRSPEMRKIENYNFGSDIWQIGHVIFELLSRKQISTNNLMKLIESKKYISQISEQFNIIFDKILVIDQSFRLNCEELLNIINQF